MSSIISTAITALVAGILVACVIWSYSKKKRRALRAVDLISYAITIIGLASSIFAINHIDKRWSSQFARLQITDGIADMMFDTGFQFAGYCSNTDKSQGKHAEECQTFKAYMNELAKIDIFHPTHLPSQSASEYKDQDVHKIADEVEKQVEVINNEIGDLGFSEINGNETDVMEYRFLRNAISVLAFAFGMGLARRAFDLYADRKS
jgi:hypothetical protein